MRVKEKEDDFVNKIVFDLMNPSVSQANALLTFLSYGSKKIEQKERDMLELTLNYCYKMQNMIKTYELINKFNHERSVMHYESIDLYVILKTMIKDYRIIFKCNSLKVKFLAKEPYIVFGDRNMIEKSLEIILRESVYTARKGSTIEICFLNKKNETEFLIRNKSLYMEFEAIKDDRKKLNVKDKNITPDFYLLKEYILAHFGCIIAESYPDNVHTYGFSLPKK